MSSIRRACVAGKFYPSDTNELAAFIRNIIPAGVEQINARGVILPHAGYVYSGKTAALTIGKVKVPDIVFPE